MKLIGNILGMPKAESDSEMLSQAFVETADFQALAETRHFNFVVGRRGSGKSAIFQKLKEKLSKEKDLFVLFSTPQEHEVLSLQSTFAQIPCEYGQVRAIMRVLWKVQLCFFILEKLLEHYKFKTTSTFAFLKSFEKTHKEELGVKGLARSNYIIRKIDLKGMSISEVPDLFARRYNLSEFERGISSALEELNKNAVICFDGLDEGWNPNLASTGVLGGLGAAASDFADRKTRIHVCLFVRDNMFRALSYYDSDFSRNIEGNTLRLHWSEDALLQLVANRLRVVKSLQDIESDVKVWNRFAHRDLKDKVGFQLCLKHTLYRPRDILVLLNSAFINAKRCGRDEIVEADVESTAQRISQDRLQDLFKEYQTVFPGLKLFIQPFQGKSAISSYSSIIELLNVIVAESRFDEEGSGDFALLDSGRQVFSALYSVGFLGLEDPKNGGFSFCHDGGYADLAEVPPDRKVLIHPCYWKALEATSEATAGEVLVQINDEYEVKQSDEAMDLRIQRIGQTVEGLNKIPLGPDGAHEFEKWVLRTIQILFAEKLQNIELKPNPNDALQKRDIVATNMAKDGFWRRVFEDYNSRQVIFEIKNYENLKIEDYRQLLSYSRGEYGNFGVIVSRTKDEGLSDAERGWVKEIHDQHGVLILIVPAVVLVRCLSKLRNFKKHNYTEEQFGKILDKFVRSYLCLRHSRRK